MTSKEIEQNLHKLIENFDKDEFIYDFLTAFDFSKTSITRLKKGDFNRSKVADEVLYRGKIFFKPGTNGKMLTEVETFSQDERIVKQMPRFVLLTDFENFVAKDTKLGTHREFSLAQLPENYDFFLPLTGAEIYKSTNDNKADRDASYQMARLYDILVDDNSELYAEHSHGLNIFLSRLLFCFFAEDTGIFEKESIFTDSITKHTQTDGSDVHTFLTDLFRRMNCEKGDFPAYVQAFPYVNGGLFRDDIVCPKFSRKAREILLKCGDLNWDEINPDIFGSMIQAVADPEERSDLGMHYTSVPNILKLIQPLFLDELYAEFEKYADNSKKLDQLRIRLSKMKFFDPACGSGNFLIITYKELRLLEIKIIQRLVELGENRIYFTDISLSQFYGIEIKDFAHEMAILSLWLAEHQMNKIFVSELQGYGQAKPILPLKDAGQIAHGNATRMDWTQVCPPKNNEVFVIGNPPYLGARMQDAEQKKDIEINFKNKKGANNLDYISIWFYKGAKYIENHKGKLAFVSTNSVCQGEQVALLWTKILNENIEIGFAHQSFKWQNNAKGNAGVTVIIVGLRNVDNSPKYLFHKGIKSEAKNINAYLLDAENVMIKSRMRPISNFPEMSFGSMPNDGGNLTLDEVEFEEYKNNNGNILCIKKLMGGSEFLNGKNRYCIWLNEENYTDFIDNKLIKSRLEKTKQHREESQRKATQKLAETYYSFGEVRHQETDSLIIPATSSERRKYIPIGFLTSATIISNSAMAVYDAEPWLFGVLHSKMHMVWVNAVGGKLKTDYRYSAKLCYNTFPFPEIGKREQFLLKEYVIDIIKARSKYPEKTMAWLYNPETMPRILEEAHTALDLAVEKIYRPHRPFNSDAERLAFLFGLYEEKVR